MSAAAIILAVVYCACGATALLAAVFNWDWFFDTISARTLGGRSHRSRARLIYGICGLGILFGATLLIR